MNPGSGQARILVVDDEEAFVRMLSDYLKLEGHQVTAAKGGLEGFRLANCGTFDIITMDIKMPEVNGVEAIRSMQIVGQDARIVVISGYLTPEVISACREAGAVEVLAKPVVLASFGAMVKDLLGGIRPKPRS